MTEPAFELPKDDFLAGKLGAKPLPGLARPDFSAPPWDDEELEGDLEPNEMETTEAMLAVHSLLLRQSEKCR